MVEEFLPERWPGDTPTPNAVGAFVMLVGRLCRESTPTQPMLTSERLEELVEGLLSHVEVLTIEDETGIRDMYNVVWRIAHRLGPLD